MRTGRNGKFCAAAGNITTTATINAPIQALSVRVFIDLLLQLPV
jgi:hypothetical protein